MRRKVVSYQPSANAQKIRLTQLSSHQPHRPAGHENAAQKHCKTVEGIADHIARSLTVGDAKNDGGKESEYESRAEVGKLNRHDAPTGDEVLADG